MQRRAFTIAAGGALCAPLARAQKTEPLAELRIVIPANAGGGWDQTGRAFGTALQSLRLVDRIQYENIGGKAGTIGLAQFVERYAAAPNTLLVSGMVMLGGIALHRPPTDLSKVLPLAELTSDYMAVAVPAASPLRQLKDLKAKLSDPAYKATVVGGSAGGVDHMLLGMMLRATQGNPDNFSYLATTSGSDAAKALTEGRAQIGISGYSEFRSAIEGGTLRALAVSAKRSLFGLPSLRDGGIATELANWRGLFAPEGLAPAETAKLTSLVERVARSPEWAELVRRNGWQASYRAGAEFRSFIDTEQTMARVVVHMLKLKA